jgi:hypothetical protein
MKVKSIFSEEVLKQIPVFYRKMTEFETKNVGELKTNARFSSSENHYSDYYLQYLPSKPVADLDISELLKELSP